MLTKNTIRLYGCGGCGINLVKPYLFGHINEAMMESDLYADIKVSLLDTSYSNVSDIINQTQHKQDFAIINDGTEGSGSLRSENVQAIRSHIKDTLITHEPLDMSIIVFSTSGGSGNVIGSMLARELAQMNKPFAIVAIADSSNQIRVKNTLDALTTLDNFAKATGVPFVASVIGNNNRADADKEAHHVISRLALLFSNHHLELDNADTTNFLNYTKVTQAPARLVALEINRVANEGDLEQIDKLSLSAVMLHSDSEAQALFSGKFYIAYSAEGFLTNIRGIEGVVPHSSIVYTVGRRDIEETLSYYDGIMGDYKKATQASTALQTGQVKLTNHSSNTEDDGFAI